MAATAPRLQHFGDRLSLAGRRFHAWWEGYPFDPDRERADILRSGGAALPEIAIAGAIWGAGRTGPGDPAWTLRHARALGLGPRASVIVYGAEGGASLRDLKAGGFSRVCGLTHDSPRARGLDLAHYDEAVKLSARGGRDGGLSFFELYRDPDPSAFARFAGERLRIGAPFALVDFAVARKGGRLKSCFPDWSPGSPRIAADYQRTLKDAGFSPTDAVDETRIYLALVARGWSRWKGAYDLAASAQSPVVRAEHMQFLAAYAALWAERYDALKAGVLQVVRILSRKTG